MVPSDAFLAKIGWTVLPPEITTQPTNQTVAAGSANFFGVASSANLVVGATGTPPLSYQWQFQGTNLVWTNLVNGGTNLLGWGSTYQLAQQRYPDHKLSGDKRQWELSGHRYQLRGLGDQFCRPADGDEYPDGIHAATDQSNGGSRFDGPIQLLTRHSSSLPLTSMAERRDKLDQWRTHQWRNQQLHAEHQQRPDKRRRNLLGCLYQLPGGCWPVPMRF